MSIFSDVGLAIKAEHWEKITNLAIMAGAEVHEHELGRLVIWHSVKWDEGHYKDVKELYGVLKELSAEDYYLQEACSEYPSIDADGNRGDWYDNPWNLGVKMSCSLYFEE